MNIKQLNEKLEILLKEETEWKNKEITHYVNQHGLTGTEQDKYYRKLQFPVKGNVYHTNMDIYYFSVKQVKEAEGLLDNDELKILNERGFIQKYNGEDWIIFPKGTRMICLGYDMDGYIFDVAGVEITIYEWFDKNFETIDDKSAIS